MTKFSRYFGRSPDRLGLEDVRAFQLYLVSQGISWPALNQTVCAAAGLRASETVSLKVADIDSQRMVFRSVPARAPRIAR
ncbi:Mobile element protein (plasmid) [Sinorhizobium sp. CCBAU 05631]|nr:Mobile element protein [Sinorhizobium sp. CCBAU 05631]